MGSCLSTNKFQGEGRTLNDPAPTAPTAAGAPSANPSGGHRLGGTSNPAPAVVGGATSQAEREARARAAEQRMSQQASKGNPNQGKLSQQLNSQKQSNPLLQKDEQPERVVWD